MVSNRGALKEHKCSHCREKIHAATFAMLLWEGEITLR
jgi:hypothetical protein